MKFVKFHELCFSGIFSAFFLKNRFRFVCLFLLFKVCTICKLPEPNPALFWVHSIICHIHLYPFSLILTSVEMWSDYDILRIICFSTYYILYLTILPILWHLLCSPSCPHSNGKAYIWIDFTVLAVKNPSRQGFHSTINLLQSQNDVSFYFSSHMAFFFQEKKEEKPKQLHSTKWTIVLAAIHSQMKIPNPQGKDIQYL